MLSETLVPPGWFDTPSVHSKNFREFVMIAMATSDISRHAAWILEELWELGFEVGETKRVLGGGLGGDQGALERFSLSTSEYDHALKELVDKKLVVVGEHRTPGWFKLRLWTEEPRPIERRGPTTPRIPPELQRAPSIRLRFAVFARDNFTCVYCGRKPPEVELSPDHVIPFSKGGKTVLENLVTSCRPCNSGKSDEELPQ